MLRCVSKCMEILKHIIGFHKTSLFPIMNDVWFRNRKYVAPLSPALPTFTIVKDLLQGNVFFEHPVFL